MRYQALKKQYQIVIFFLGCLLLFYSYLKETKKKNSE
jgi:hypothetical protein